MTLFIALALIAVLLGGLAAYVANSITRVDGSKERVVVFRFGKKENKVYTGGLVLRLWLIDTFKSFPTGLQQLRLTGEVLGEVKALSKEEGELVGIEISADVSIKFKFPDGDDLIAVAHLVKNPWDPDELTGLIGSDTRELCKEILSRFPYDVAYSNVGRKLDNAIKTELQNLKDEHALRQLNLCEISIQIENVRISQGIKDAREAKEIASRMKEKRKIDLSIEEEEIRRRGEAQAEAQKKKMDALGSADDAFFSEAETAPDGSFKGKRISVPNAVVDAIDGITGRAAKNVGKGIVETLVEKAKKMLGNDKGAKKS